MTARPALALILAAAALGLPACGGDDEDGAGSDALPRAELAARADAICKTATDAGRAVQAPADFGQPNSDPDASAEYLGQIAPITRKQQEDLAALEPDDEAKADWDALVAKHKELTEFLDGVLAKARAKDPSGIEDLARAPQLGQEFTTAARKIGADGCADG